MKIKSEKADTAEEFYEQAKSILEDLNVSDPTVGESGSIPVNNSRSYVVEDTTAYNTTRTGQKVLNQFPRTSSERIITSSYDRPICNVMPCSVTEFLGIDCVRTVEQFIDPEIEIQNNPTEIPTVNAHLNPFNPRIEGDVEITGANLSKPGKVIREEIHKCSDESSKEEETIDESAVVSMEAEHGIIDETVDESIDTVTSVVPNVNPGSDKTAQVRFRKNGTIGLLKGLLEAWTTGAMSGRITGDVTVEYEWKSSIKTETFSIDSRVTLPVRDINYDW